MGKKKCKINDFYNELKEKINDENFFLFSPEFKYYSTALSIPLLKEQLSVQHLNLIFQMMISFEKNISFNFYGVVLFYKKI